MNETVLTTIAFTGFTVAFFHAAIPTHWLPFVAAGRAQRWSYSKTLLITALAGTGRPHDCATWFNPNDFWSGTELAHCHWFPRIAGALLIGLGLFYVWRQLSGHAHSHTHLFPKGAHGGNEQWA
jgi:nickel/cobalt transporter (NicO) family protein